MPASPDFPTSFNSDGVLAGAHGGVASSSRQATQSGLEAFAAALGVDAAARDRASQRWMEQQASESSTLIGVLADLGEAGDPVMVTFAGGRRASVRVAAVGRDVVSFEHREGHRSTMRTDSLAAVRAPSGREVAGDRQMISNFTFEDAVAFLGGERPDVSLFDRSGDPALSGRLVSTGIDVLKLRLEASRSEVVHVPLSAVGGVSLI